MGNGLLLRGTALAVFLALFAGSTYAAFQAIHPEGLHLRGVTVTPVRSSLNATAGNAVSYALILGNAGEIAEDVTFALAPGSPVTLAAPVRAVSEPGAKSGAFVTVLVPPGTPPGDVSFTLKAKTGGTPSREYDVPLHVRVLEPGTGIREGAEGLFRVVGRLADGTIFESTVVDVTRGPFPKGKEFRSGDRPMRLVTGTNSNVVRGLAVGVIGMVPGESRTIVLTPEEAFGNATIHEARPRTTTLERTYFFPAANSTLPRRAFDDYVDNKTPQGPSTKYKAGDKFFFRSEVNDFPLRILSIDATTVEFRLDPEIGEKFTFYPFWPLTSEVVAKNFTTVEFYTTPPPTAATGFTFHEFWPNASHIVEMNATHVVVRHDPREGMSFSQTTGPYAPSREYRVVAVRPDEIEVEYHQVSDLAGKTVIYDVERAPDDGPA